MKNSVVVARVSSHSISVCPVQASIICPGHPPAEWFSKECLHPDGHAGLSLQYSLHGEHACQSCQGTQAEEGRVASFPDYNLTECYK